MSTILVIDASLAVQETLRIVLQGDYQVVAAASLDTVPAPDLAAMAPALVILGLSGSPGSVRATAGALAPLRPDVPVLVLNAPANVDVRALLAPGRRVDFLPKPFDAYALRARVHALLAAPGPMRAALPQADYFRRYLEPPLLPQATAAIVGRVLTTDVPLLLSGEAGSGIPELARAIHLCSGRPGSFTVVRGEDLPTPETRRLLDDAPGAVGGTLFVDRVDLASPPGQQLLLALLRAPAPGEAPTRVRLLASTVEHLPQSAAAGQFLAELAYALTICPIFLVPLRERPGDIPALVRFLTDDLAARLQLERVTYSEAALARLARYLWFGNVAELEAVIARTLALHRPARVEAADLLFLPEDLAAMTATGPPRAFAAAAPPSPPTPDLAASSLEVLLGELAHELRNPMVTIKTFAQHLDSVMREPEVRERFSRLTVEAVDRMNDLLETLLDFARFRLPAPRRTNVRQLLDDALAEQADVLARKGIRLEHDESGSLWVATDEIQVAFALRQLVAGFVHDLTPHEVLQVATLPDGALALRVRLEPSTAQRLAAWVDTDNEAPTGDTPPLRLTLAAALLQRNGGTLAVRNGKGGTTVITVSWPRSAREG